MRLINLKFQSFIRLYWKHLVAWGLVIIYFFVSPKIFDIPIEKQDNFNNETAYNYLETTLGNTYIDGLDPIILEGKELYKLWGWAFLTINKEDPPDQYKRFVHLESETQEYVFPLTSVPRPGVQEHFKDLEMDLINAGFYSNISKDSITPGIYKISLLFENQEGNFYLLRSSRMIERTLNYLKIR